LKLVDEKTKEKYIDFLSNHERSNFQQTIEWGKVKKSWRNKIIIVEDEKENIVGSISVLIRKIPIFGNMIYAPRGPVCDIHDKKVLQELTSSLKELAKKEKAFVLKMEPDVESNDKEFRSLEYSISPKPYPLPFTTAIISHGFLFFFAYFFISLIL